MDRRSVQLTRQDALLFSALVLVVLAVALPMLTYPMGRDQGMYANIARNMLNGGLPFIDMWDIKPPAIYYIYAAGIAVFGPGAVAIRAMDLVAVPLVMAGLYWLGLRFANRRAALLTGFIFAVFYFTETFSTLTQSDSLVTVPMTWAVICVVLAGDAQRGSRSAMVWSAAAGALCASTIWFKHYYALFVLALVLEHLIRRRGLAIKEAFAFSLGGLPVGVIPLAYFYATGVWDEMLIVAQGTAAYNADAASSLDEFIEQMRSYVLFRWWHWGPMLVLALSWLVAPLPSPLNPLSHKGRGDFSQGVLHEHQSEQSGIAQNRIRSWAESHGLWRVVGLWLAAGLGFVLIQAKGFDTHWIPMLPPLALLAGAALDAWLRAGLKRIPHLPAIPIYGLVAVLLLAILAKDTWVRAWPYLTGAESQRAYYGNFQANDLKPDESVRIINYLSKRTTPGDTLYIWGFRPEVYYLTELRPATRFQAQFPLVGDRYPVEWQQENVDVLWAALPPYVLVMQADEMPWVTGRETDSATILFHEYTELNSWLVFNYEQVREIGDFLIWQRKDLID